MLCCRQVAFPLAARSIVESTGVAGSSEPRRVAQASAVPDVPDTVNADSVGSDFKTLLRDRHFRALFTAHFASNLGDWLAFMALFSLSAFEWQRGVGGISLLAIAYTLPFMTLAPLAGVWVDRWDLRRILIWSDLLRAAIVVAMALSSGFTVMCLLLLLHQSVSTFFGPAQHAAIPRLVQRPHILAANALNTQASHFTKILGPGVAGILVSLLGARGCFYLDAGTFALSALLLATLPSMLHPARKHREHSFAHDFRSGVRFLLDAPRLRTVVTLLAVSLWALGAFIATLPIFARDQLGAGPRIMGFLLSSLGLGAVGGAVAVVHVGKRVDKIAAMTGGAALAALAVWLLSTTTHSSLGVLATGTLGTGLAALLVPAHALVQEETPTELLGRVISLAVAVLSVAQVSGMALAAAGARLLDPPQLLTAQACGLGAAAIGVAFWRLWRHVR
jgi:MFS family permease